MYEFCVFFNEPSDPTWTPGLQVWASSVESIRDAFPRAVRIYQCGAEWVRVA